MSNLGRSDTRTSPYVVTRVVIPLHAWSVWLYTFICTLAFWLNVTGVWKLALLPAIRSLERKARYLFYCMFFVCFFVCSVNDFSTTRGPIHAKVRMQAYSPAGGKKGQMKFSLVWEFLHFGGFWAISQQRLHGSTPNIICVETMFADVPPPLWCQSAPGGRGRGS